MKWKIKNVPNHQPDKDLSSEKREQEMYMSSTEIS
jgi:hypothetical protein